MANKVKKDIKQGCEEKKKKKKDDQVRKQTLTVKVRNYIPSIYMQEIVIMRKSKSVCHFVALCNN